MEVQLQVERSAKDIVDDAIAENSHAGWLLYGFATVFVLVGLGVLVVGAVRGDSLTGALGFVESMLFMPAMNAARRTRKENIAIRLLEAPLGKSSSEHDAARMLHGLVQDIMNDKRGEGK